MSSRKSGTLVWPRHSSNRSAGRRLARSLTETSSLLAPTFPLRESVCSSQDYIGKRVSGILAFLFFQMKRDFNIRKNFVRQCCVVRCAEVLFQPSVIGKEPAEFFPFFQMKRDADIHNDVYTCVVSSGGTTMFSVTGDHYLISRPFKKKNARSGCGVVIRCVDQDKWITHSKIAVLLKACTAMAAEVGGVCVQMGILDFIPRKTINVNNNRCIDEMMKSR